MSVSKVILLPNPAKDDGLRIARRVIHQLSAKGATVWVHKQFQTLCWEEAELYEEPPRDADLCVVMGGDGSVLDAAPFAVENDIPLVGINLGRLGFLAQVETNRLFLLDRVFEESLPVTERMVLELTLRRRCEEESVVHRCAVNDVVVQRSGSDGLPDFSVCDSNANLINYRADGVILATPGGSSAYSLSAGGPLVNPDVEAICMTPICCHSFFNRSVLFGPGTTVTVKNTSERGIALSVSVDGRPALTIEPGDEITVKKADRTLRTVDFSESGMLSTLRRKMEAAELNRDI